MLQQFYNHVLVARQHGCVYIVELPSRMNLRSATEFWLVTLSK